MCHANGICSRLGVFCTRAAREKYQWELTGMRAVFETGDPAWKWSTNAMMFPLTANIVLTGSYSYHPLSDHFKDFSAFSKPSMAEEQKKKMDTFQFLSTPEVVREFRAALHNVSSNRDAGIGRLQHCEHLHVYLPWKKQTKCKKSQCKKTHIP